MPRNIHLNPRPVMLPAAELANHEWNAVSLSNCSRSEAARRLIGAHQYVDLILGNQPRCQLLRERRVTLMIDEDKFELGPAHIWQASGLGERQFAEFGVRVIDYIGGDFGGGLGSLAGRGCIAGQRPDNPDFDRLCRVGLRCGVKREGGCRSGDRFQHAKSLHVFPPRPRLIIGPFLGPRPDRPTRHCLDMAPLLT